MAIYIASGTLAPGLVYNGVDLSDHVHSIEVQMNSDDVDVTAMGATSHQHAPGLRDDRIIVEFYQDFAANKVDATLSGFQGSSSGATLVAYANGTVASSTAPKYTLVASPFTYSPINLGAPGDASMTQVTFLPVAGGAISRGTT